MTGQKVRCRAKGTPPSKKKGLCFFFFFWGSRGQRRKRGHQQICPRVSILLRKLEVAKERRKRGVFFVGGGEGAKVGGKGGRGSISKFIWGLSFFRGSMIRQRRKRGEEGGVVLKLSAKEEEGASEDLSGG